MFVYLKKVSGQRAGKSFQVALVITQATVLVTCLQPAYGIYSDTIRHAVVL